MLSLKNFYKVLGILILLLMMSVNTTASTDITNFKVPYESYIHNYWGDTTPTPLPYLPDEVYDFSDSEMGELKNPRDLFVTTDNNIIIADTGNNRIVCLDENLQLINVIQDFKNNDILDTFNKPTGVFVDEDGYIYVADRENQRIVKLDIDGQLQKIVGYPVPEVEGILPKDFKYKPIKVNADKAGRLYVLSEDVYEGLLQFDSNGKFQGFIGAPEVRINIVDLIWKYIATDEQEDRMALTLPTEYYNIDIDERGFIYATVSITDSEEGKTIRKLNPSGEDVLRRNGFWSPMGDIWWPDQYSDASITGPSFLVDIAVQDYGVYSALDSNRGRVFTYDNDGNLLYVFGYNTDKHGALRNASALDFLGDKILILDSEKNWLNIYRPTQYTNSIMAAIEYHYNGEYEKSTEMWHEVLKYNINYDLAYSGIGRANLRQDEFRNAMTNFRLGNDRDDYSEALGLYRREIIGRNFGWIITIIILLYISSLIYKKLRVKKSETETAAVDDGSVNKYYRKYKDLLNELKYSLYLVFHPFDGFWDLKHEKRGSVKASIVILITVCLTYIFMRQYTGFIFNHRDLSDLNILMEFLSVIVPFLLWCIVNWSLTTLVEGKGTFRDIFVASSYALTPIVLVNIPLTIISNFITREEGAFYGVFLVIAIVWTAYLLFFGIMVTHRFEMKKNLITTIITFAGMIFVIFVSVLFFNLAEQVFAFASEIYHEIIFRM